MIPSKAYIYNGGDYPFEKKICGLYPLERLIHILAKAGVKTFYIDLSEKEISFFDKKIKKHINRLKNIKIITGKKPAAGSKYLRIPVNLFTMQHYFESFNSFFSGKGKQSVPNINGEQFLIKTYNDIIRARELVKRRLVDTTEGFFARNINKRVSVPISSRLAATRIHPNAITAVNMLLGILSALLVYYNTYWSVLAGGLLFQSISIIDGVDGEVAKFTFRSSRFGANFDTISDLTSLVLFFLACSYLYFLNFEGFLAYFFIILLIAGLVLSYIAQWMFLSKYKGHSALKAYLSEFLEKLPKDDKLVMIALSLKYFVKKEFYSYLLLFGCIIGRADLIIPFGALFLVMCAFLLLMLNKRYLSRFV